MKLNRMPKKKKTGIKRNIWDFRRLRHGSYSIVLTAVVVAAAVILNLVVEEIPSQYTKFDFSDRQLSVLTEQTKEVLDGLTSDITLYYVVQDGAEDSYVERLLERYEDASSYITVVTKDPVLYPKFTSQYTEESISENSVIAACGEQSRIIAYEDMYETELNYNYFSYETTGFDAEGQITSAIAALQTEKLPTVYTTTGHGEASLPDALLQSLEKENLQTDTLNLITADAVPEDADCVLMVSPSGDISAEEAEKLLAYLQSGGCAVFLLDYGADAYENLAEVLAYYGTSVGEGVVIEGDSSYYVQLPYYLVPDINGTEVSSDMTNGSAYVLLAAAQPLVTASEMKTDSSDARDSLSFSSILSSSSSAYTKSNPESMTTYEKEAGDTDGPFDLGVLITESVESGTETETETAESGTETEAETAESGTETEAETAESGTETEAESTDVSAEKETSEGNSEEGEQNHSDETRIAVFTSSALIDESADQMVSGGNYKLFMNTLSWLCGRETSVSVPVKSLSVSYLTLTSASSSFWSIITIAVIPGLFLISGLSIWLRRRKR